MNKYSKRIDKLNRLLELSKNLDLQPVECDSTWESVYEFKPIRYDDRFIWIETKEVYMPYTEDKDRYLIHRDIEEIQYALNWFYRCIKKAYSENNLKCPKLSEL